MFQAVNFSDPSKNFFSNLSFLKITKTCKFHHVWISNYCHKNQRNAGRIKKQEFKEKCMNVEGKHSILISCVCKPVIINNDCRCSKWMFMNAILMKRHQGECREEETTEGSANMVNVGGEGG